MIVHSSCFCPYSWHIHVICFCPYSCNSAADLQDSNACLASSMFVGLFPPLFYHQGIFEAWFSHPWITICSNIEEETSALVFRIFYTNVWRELWAMASNCWAMALEEQLVDDRALLLLLWSPGVRKSAVIFDSGTFVLMINSYGGQDLKE